jgi:choice-of-anchor C domain-containing protein
MKTPHYLLAAMAGLTFAGPISAASIVNGSFEIGSDPGSFSSQAAGSSAITGWTVGGFGVDYIGSYWQASDGVRSIDLSLGNAGSVAQTLSTIIGRAYTVNFDLSGNPDGSPQTKTVVVSINGSEPSIQTYTVGPANSRQNMNWQNYSYTFTAFQAASTLVFASADSTAFGAALDNVSVLDEGGIGSTVPEPASWAMLIVGFGLIGVSSRRRQRVVAA